MLVVPGFTPPWTRHPVELHALAEARLRKALGWLGVWPELSVIVTGAAVYPEGTPHVEAESMARWLASRGVSEQRIVVEGSARHTTTNLRNAARVMGLRGWRRARIVTDPGQALYLAFADRSGFRARYVRDLGHDPGVLSWHGWWTVDFEPGPGVEGRGTDPREP